MRRELGVLLLIAAVSACQKELTPTEKAAKDRSECMVVALDQSGFDPLTAEEPPRTISSSQKRGSDAKEAVKDVATGAAGGAVAGVVGGAIMGNVGRGAAAGAAVGGLVGGVHHYQKSQETVTTTRPNPEYQKYAEGKAAYKRALDECLAARAEAPK